MATIELEFRELLFQAYAEFLLSVAPNPLPTLRPLGRTRLIHHLEWGTVRLHDPLPGYVPPPGTLVVGADLRVTHLSTQELDANPNAAGTTSDTKAWVQLSASVNPASLAAQLLAIEVSGHPRAYFTPPVGLDIRAGVPDDAGPASPAVAAALLLSDGIVTIRFATDPADNVLAPPVNVLATVTSVTDRWSYRVSPEVFTATVLRTIQEGLASLPPDVLLEDAPEVAWVEEDGVWRVKGSFGIEKVDACPALFEDVDVSVTVDVRLTPTPNPAATPPRLDLTLRLESDASDWDAFRCWLGSGGLLSLGLGIVAWPAGIIAGIATLVSVGEKVASGAHSELVKVGAGPQFQQVASDDDSVTYAGGVPLPLQGVDGATMATGPLGFVIIGSMLFLRATHVATYSPNVPSLPTSWYGSYDCKRKLWYDLLLAEGVSIQDTAIVQPDVNAPPLFSAPIPVTVFPTSIVKPGDAWALERPAAPAVNAFVGVVSLTPVGVQPGSPADLVGMTARIYLHTSAGVRRFDVDAVPVYTPPNPTTIAVAEVNCRGFSRNWTRMQMIEWLVDPPPYDFGIRPVRQWQITISQVPEGANLTIQRQRHGRAYLEPMRITADRAASLSIELVTDADTTLSIEHTLRTTPHARLSQRWLLPRKVIELGEAPREIIRSGNQLAVRTDLLVATLGLRTGRQRLSAAGAGSQVEAPTGMAAALRRRSRAAAAKRGALPPYSVTLPDGQVAAAWENSLVIAMPFLVTHRADVPVIREAETA